MKDIYKWWSKKALKAEILKLKNTYNELFDAMLKFQEENRALREAYNKANEWNNVKDKLPVNDEYKIYIVIDKYNCSVVARFYNNKWCSYTVIRDVVLWKEIELPSDKEVEQAIKDINKLSETKRTDKEPNVDNSFRRI